MDNFELRTNARFPTESEKGMLWPQRIIESGRKMVEGFEEEKKEKRRASVLSSLSLSWFSVIHSLFGEVVYQCFGQPRLFEWCMEIWVLMPAHEYELRGPLVYLLIVKYLSVLFKFTNSILDWPALSWNLGEIFLNIFRAVCRPYHLQGLYGESELIYLL